MNENVVEYFAFFSARYFFKIADRSVYHLICSRLFLSLIKSRELKDMFLDGEKYHCLYVTRNWRFDLHSILRKT